MHGNKFSRGVTVVIPCWNGAKFVSDAILSVLSQSLCDVEVLVVDDGSTDKSLDILNSFGNKIRIIRSMHEGACSARNIGWKNAKYDLIKFLDSDDVLAEGILISQVKSLEKIEDAERQNKTVIIGDVEIMNHHGHSVGEIHSFHKLPRKNEAQTAFLIIHNVQTASPLHQRGMLERIGGFDENWPNRQEWNLHVRLSASGAEFIHEPGVVVRVRQHDEPLRISNKKLNAEEFSEMIDRGNNLFLRELPQLVGGPVGPEVGNAIGRALWSTGRYAARLGYNNEARKLFRSAQTFLDGAIPGKMLYRLAAGTLGPIRYDRFRARLEETKNLKDAIAFARSKRS